jgi:hypothetical protein
MVPLIINDLRKWILAIFNFFTAPDRLLKTPIPHFIRRKPREIPFEKHEERAPPPWRRLPSALFTLYDTGGDTLLDEKRSFPKRVPNDAPFLRTCGLHSARQWRRLFDHENTSGIIFTA